VREIQVSAGTLHVEEYGSGPVLLTGSGCDAADELFRDVCPILGDSYRVIRHHWVNPMTPNFNGSVEAIDQLLNELGCEQAYLVGQCFFANLYLGYAAKRPERVKALLMADPIVQRWEPDFRPPEGYPYPWPPRTSSEWAFMKGMDWVLPNGGPSLRTLQVPCMILYGDRDPMYQLAGFTDEIEVSPTVPILPFPGVRHLGAREPEEFCGVVMEFLSDPGARVTRVWSGIDPGFVPPVKSWC
jgi:pimeloyl-ACP methyl ester carboxylesterase